MVIPEKDVEHCGRCMLEYRMARDPDRPYGIVLPPHHRRCPKVAIPRPEPLLPAPGA